MHLGFVEPSRRHTDIIIPEGGQCHGYRYGSDQGGGDGGGAGILRSGETLLKKVARGGAIAGVSFVTEEVFRFVRTLALAKMLSPTDFGLMASKEGLRRTIEWRKQV